MKSFCKKKKMTNFSSDFDISSRVSYQKEHTRYTMSDVKCYQRRCETWIILLRHGNYFLRDRNIEQLNNTAGINYPRRMNIKQPLSSCGRRPIRGRTITQLNNFVENTLFSTYSEHGTAPSRNYFDSFRFFRNFDFPSSSKKVNIKSRPMEN